jgi:hypothetical protein
VFLMSKIFYYPLVLALFIFLLAFVNSLVFLQASQLKILNLGTVVVFVMWLAISVIHWGGD